MSKSKFSYGVRERKGTARAHSRRPDTSDGENSTETGPEPACRSRYVDEWNWREIPYNDRLLSSYRVCEWSECFGGSPPDTSEIETVIRSQRAPTVIHRPHEPDTDTHTDTHSHDATDETHDEHTDESAFRIESLEDYQPITAVAELQIGDGVIWGPLETPKVVIERNDESSAVTLKGPAGGEFVLRERHDAELLVYPGHGCVSVSRIPADDRPEAI
jgi:hypothetical protein